MAAESAPPADGVADADDHIDGRPDVVFVTATERYRRELFAHCYRMLDSVDDADDLVQETYVRAWRAYGQFEHRSSLRLWLYTIATRVCLTALESRRRRPLPSGLVAPSHDHRVDVSAPDADVPWLQPVPDALLSRPSDDPASIVAARAGVRLAFIAALQHLSARQRALLVLRDVLRWPARDTAEILGTTMTAVNSALRRARSVLAEAGPVEDRIAEPLDAQTRSLLDRYVAAFERADLDALSQLMRLDVELEMPPIPTWFTGRPAVLGFIAEHVLRGDDRWHLVPTSANTQPAVIVWAGPAQARQSHGVHVLTVVGRRIARLAAFNDAGLVDRFASDD